MRSRLNLFFRAVLFAFTAATFAAMATGGDRPALQPFPRDCVWGNRKVNDARRFADAWREQYPGTPVPKAVESFEISEYGRPPIEEDFELLMG